MMKLICKLQMIFQSKFSKIYQQIFNYKNKLERVIIDTFQNSS